MNNKITCKERKRAADLIAIKAGRLRCSAADIDAAAKMTDEQIKDFLKYDDMAADPEQKENKTDNLQVDVITPGAPVVTEDLFDLCSGLINNICIKFDLDKNMSPLQWSFVCSRVGAWFRSRSAFRIEQKNCIASNNIKQLDYDAIAAAVPAWLDLCGIYNKVPFKSDFCAFIGLPPQTIYKNAGDLSSGGSDLYKILDSINADGLRKRVINSKESPIGAIFLLKADHGLIEAQKVTVEHVKTDASGAALPVFGADPAEISEKP